MLAAMVRTVTLVIFLHETGRESRLLYRAVRHELDPQTVGRGFDVLRHLVAAVGPQQRGVGAVPVSDLQIVVETVPARLDVKVPE